VGLGTGGCLANDRQPEGAADDLIAVRQEGQALGDPSAVSALNSSMRISSGQTMPALMA